MPELPEAERARQQIEKALDREIVAVDDTDTYVCRPHTPGEIESALVGHKLTKALRRGKFLWAETDDGPELGLHLGMAGRIVVDEAPDAMPAAVAASLGSATALQTLTERLARTRGVDPDPIHRDVDRYREAADAADATA